MWELSRSRNSKPLVESLPPRAVTDVFDLKASPVTLLYKIITAGSTAVTAKSKSQLCSTDHFGGKRFAVTGTCWCSARVINDNIDFGEDHLKFNYSAFNKGRFLKLQDPFIKG